VRRICGDPGSPRHEANKGCGNVAAEPDAKKVGINEKIMIITDAMVQYFSILYNGIQYV
jgi:hypothetical protein